MKEWLRKISFTLLLAAAEIVLGVLLLAKPKELTSFVIVTLGLFLIISGAFQLFHYIRLPREEAAKTWKLASGTGMIVIGTTFISNQHWLVEVMGALITLYGAMTLAACFLKLQIAMDALRGRRSFWYLMGISFLLTAVLSMLMFLHPFTESALWIVSGVSLVLLAVLDAAYFFLGRKKKEPTGNS